MSAETGKLFNTNCNSCNTIFKKTHVIKCVDKLAFAVPKFAAFNHGEEVRAAYIHCSPIPCYPSDCEGVDSEHQEGHRCCRVYRAHSSVDAAREDVRSQEDS